MSNQTFFMRNFAKRSAAIVIAITLCLTMCAGTAFAYFTSTAQATGSHDLTLKYSSELTENIENGNKQISMQNTGETDIMVRVQLFFGTGINNNISVETPGAEDWTQSGSVGNETWTYTKVLAAGESTSVLPVNVSAAEGTDLANFEITVIGQTSPVYYDESGAPVPYLWSSANPDVQE